MKRQTFDRREKRFSWKISKKFPNVNHLCPFLNVPQILPKFLKKSSSTLRIFPEILFSPGPCCPQGVFTLPYVSRTVLAPSSHPATTHTQTEVQNGSSPTHPHSTLSLLGVYIVRIYSLGSCLYPVVDPNPRPRAFKLQRNPAVPGSRTCTCALVLVSDPESSTPNPCPT